MQKFNLEKIKIFYPSVETSKNHYGLFSPSIDRFILVDNIDPLTLFETSQILSSKINSVVYIINHKIENNILTSENCLEFSTENKKGENLIGSSNMGAVKQTASMVFLKSNLVNKGLPNSNLETVTKIKDYANFVLTTVYALNLANAFRNIFSESEYLENYFKNEYPKSFLTFYDTTESSTGIVKETKNILFHSDSIDEAVEKIYNLWESNTKKDPSGFKEMFFDLLGLKNLIDDEKIHSITNEISIKIL
jgi:hypothetical protein